MFRYYRRAKVCYVYLCDFGLARSTGHSAWSTDTLNQFRAARWFTRGWTLQELIAPLQLEFYDCEWKHIGDSPSRKRGGPYIGDLRFKLSEITSIDHSVLQNPHLDDYLRKRSIAERMSWAASRSTAREEDRAYSLLGIFDINMPLLYGEGRKAFQRLQEEIIRQSTVVDHSILAWLPWKEEPRPSSQSDGIDNIQTESTSSDNNVLVVRPYNDLLSPSPYGFRYSAEIVSWDTAYTEEFQLTQRGIRMTAHIQTLDAAAGKPHQYRAELNCRYKGRTNAKLGILLDHIPHIHPERPDAKVDNDLKLLFCERVDDSEHNTFKAVPIAAANTRGPTTIILSKTPFERPEAVKIWISTKGSGLSVQKILGSPCVSTRTYGREHVDGSSDFLALTRGGSAFVDFPLQQFQLQPTTAILHVEVEEIQGHPGTKLSVSLHNTDDQEFLNTSWTTNFNRYSQPIIRSRREIHSSRSYLRNMPPDKTEYFKVSNIQQEHGKEVQHRYLAVRTEYVNVADEVVWYLQINPLEQATNPLPVRGLDDHKKWLHLEDVI